MRSQLEQVIEVRVLAAALHLMKDRPLAELIEFVDKRGAANGLERVRLEDLAHPPSSTVVERRQRAEATRGKEYDSLALGVLLEAEGEYVGPSHLKLRLGGPRWKIRSSMNRLEKRGEVCRTGSTSDRKYAAKVDSP